MEFQEDPCMLDN